MPLICEFSGLKVYMYYHDHLPPHVHVVGAGVAALVLIPEGTVIEGGLPPGAAVRVGRWARENAEALMENWSRARQGKPLFKVPAPASK